MLASNPPTMTEFDMHRLDALFERIRHQVSPPSTLTVLERELQRAIVVKPEEVPATVVTMNSQVEVTDLDTNCWEAKREPPSLGRRPAERDGCEWSASCTNPRRTAGSISSP
jgi:hypothetical protein